MTAGLVIGLVAGLLVGLAIGWLLHAQRRSADVTSQAAETADLRARLAAEQARHAELERAAAERAAAREEDLKRLAGTFAELSQEALARNTEQFLAVATQQLSSAQDKAASELQQRQEAIAQLLRPLQDTLGKYEVNLKEMEAARQQAYAGLTERVTQLSHTHAQLERETRNLVTALRDVRTRGRWGELQLRRVVELTGMVDHCDFDEQVALTGDEGGVRPDMVVHAPGGLQVVVDAKVPLDAYLQVLDAENEEQHAAALRAHARQVRAHVDDMAKRSYPNRIPGAVDVTVVFVPGDGLLAAAYDSDPTLQEYALSKSVLLATPTTLIGLLRTIAFGWRQESIADNARTVQRLGEDLFRRLAKMGEHLERLGKNLSNAVKSYNEAVGSMETRVLVTARKFTELGATGPDDTIPMLEAIEVAPRPLQAPVLRVETGDADAALPAGDLPGLAPGEPDAASG